MELSWWNLIPTYFDGTAFELGSFPVRWYGIMYIFAFVTAYLTMWKISQKEKLGYTKEQLDNLFTWIIAGILLGARLGYVFFYKASYYLSNPTEIIFPMMHDDLGYHFVGISGMSYHGGLILGIIFCYIGAKRNKLDVWKTFNLAMLAAPLAYTWGRYGNFINGEKGKGGVAYPCRSAVCLETQQYPDSPNHHWPESTGRLLPGYPFESTTIFKFK